jgi:hypothetical protein
MEKKLQEDPKSSKNAGSSSLKKPRNLMSWERKKQKKSTVLSNLIRIQLR